MFSIVFSLSPNSSTFHILQQLHEHDVPPHGVCAPATHACNCKHCLVEGALRFGIRCGFPFVFLLPSLVWNLNDLDLRTVVLSSSAFLCCSCCHKYLLLSWSKTKQNNERFRSKLFFWRPVSLHDFLLFFWPPAQPVGFVTRAVWKELNHCQNPCSVMQRYARYAVSLCKVT